MLIYVYVEPRTAIRRETNIEYGLFPVEIAPERLTARLRDLLAKLVTDEDGRAVLRTQSVPVGPVVNRTGRRERFEIKELSETGLVDLLTAIEARDDALFASEAQRREREAREKALEACWIDRHGSDRLKACLAEGIEYGAIYADERMAVERPGWTDRKQYQREKGIKLELLPPRNPPAEALSLLATAREADPDCQIQFFKAEWARNQKGTQTIVATGYLACGTYLDRSIITAGNLPWPAGEPEGLKANLPEVQRSATDQAQRRSALERRPASCGAWGEPTAASVNADKAMSLWHLEPTPEGFDRVRGTYIAFVVRAATEAEARELVASRTALLSHRKTWASPRFSTCEPLAADGRAEIIIGETYEF